MTIDELNSLPAEIASEEFRKCCGSSDWIAQITQARPFASLDDLNETAKSIWWSLDADDWLEAFHSHPKIGEKKAAAQTSEQSRRWSEGEQSGIAAASSAALQELAALNRIYEDKFGYIFIVCATGKSSEEMLKLLKDRLRNEADEELRIAAAEQAKITELRLNKLLEN